MEKTVVPRGVQVELFGWQTVTKKWQIILSCGYATAIAICKENFGGDLSDMPVL